MLHLFGRGLFVFGDGALLPSVIGVVVLGASCMLLMVGRYSFLVGSCAISLKSYQMVLGSGGDLIYVIYIKFQHCSGYNCIVLSPLFLSRGFVEYELASVVVVRGMVFVYMSYASVDYDTILNTLFSSRDFVDVILQLFYLQLSVVVGRGLFEALLLVVLLVVFCIFLLGRAEGSGFASEYFAELYSVVVNGSGFAIVIYLACIVSFIPPNSVRIISNCSGYILLVKVPHR